jgi:hypothetical protein
MFVTEVVLTALIVNGINMAANQTARQVGTPNVAYIAQYAVDGDYSTMSCTGVGNQRWWCVDLGRQYNVSAVTVVNDFNSANGNKIKCE